MLTELKKLTCVCCRGELVKKEDKYVCKYCKSVFEEVERVTEEEVISLNRATEDRKLLRFDEAFEEYNLLLKKYPENEMANWGAFLCDYGIIYEDDDDGRIVPTCHRLNERPVAKSPYYAKLTETHKQYADEIERLRLSIMAESKKIPPYDVFICYKKTRENSDKPTREASWARDMYEFLTYEMKLKVFFAEKSLEGTNAGYEPHIYAALRSAKLMFVLAGSIKNVESGWVANEWKRYAKYVQDGEEKTLRVVYDNIEPYELPKALQSKQGIDHNAMGWDQAVRKAVEEVFYLNQEKPEWQRQMDVMRAQMNAMQRNGGGANDPQDKFCAKCGKGHVHYAKFCEYCGNAIFVKNPTKLCNNCGKEMALAEPYCPKCRKNSFSFSKEEYNAELERKRKAEEEKKERMRQAELRRQQQEEERKKQEQQAKTQSIVKTIFNIILWVVIVVVAFNVLNGCANCMISSMYMEFELSKSYEEEYYILTKYDDPNATTVEIPKTYDGKPVRTIGARAFSNCDELETIYIHDSVTAISEYAFLECNSLKTIKFEGTEETWREIYGETTWGELGSLGGLSGLLGYDPQKVSVSCDERWSVFGASCVSIQGLFSGCQ